MTLIDVIHVWSDDREVRCLDDTLLLHVVLITR